MSKIILVTGGARSGKSTFGEQTVEKMGENIGYIATGIAFDEGMKNRIKIHQQNRPSDWTTYEFPTIVSDKIEQVARTCDAYILDCITVLTTNILLKDHEIDWDAISFDAIHAHEMDVINEIDNIIDQTRKHNLNAVFVTNEVGSGIVPENRLSRIYRDIAGRVNQHLAKNVDEVYVTIAGIPQRLK
jgi:adenosylcobinamide kinase/adenosylcobinamide-phosphate guanylyltransferase